jgi:dTDP-4-dehydrorhamnose 3,5-epimerase-like enzyme|tara:strand:+ start:165 stop:539 length:375 start_codon:yes stop_codon:yes gene_type:complete
MAKIINLKTFSEKKGDLTVIEKILPFEIKRIYYIYNCDGSVRGNHRHKKTRQAIVCVKGSVDFYCQNQNQSKKKFILNQPDKCLLIEPEDFHWFDKFSSDAFILVMASEYFDESDYIFDKGDEN